MGTGVPPKRIATRNVIRSFYGTDNLSLCPSRVQFRAQSLMTDVEARKRGEQTGLDTLVDAVNDEY